MEDKIFRADAKQIVDMAFDNKLFKNELTRDDFNTFEDVIQFLLQSRYESYRRVENLTNKISERNNEKARSMSSLPSDVEAILIRAKSFVPLYMPTEAHAKHNQLGLDIINILEKYKTK